MPCVSAVWNTELYDRLAGSFKDIFSLLSALVIYRVIGIKQFARSVIQVCEWLQAGIAIF